VEIPPWKILQLETNKQAELLIKCGGQSESKEPDFKTEPGFCHSKHYFCKDTEKNSKNHEKKTSKNSRVCTSFRHSNIIFILVITSFLAASFMPILDLNSN